MLKHRKQKNKQKKRTAENKLPCAKAQKKNKCRVLKRIFGPGVRVEARFLNARAQAQKTKKRTAGNELPCASSTKKNKGVR